MLNLSKTLKPEDGRLFLQSVLVRVLMENQSIQTNTDTPTNTQYCTNG